MKRRLGLIGLGLALLAFIVGAAINGIIGNRADALLVDILQQANETLPSTIRMSREVVIGVVVLILILAALLIRSVVLYRGTSLVRENYALIDENNQLVHKHGDLLRANTAIQSDNNKLFENIGALTAHNKSLAETNTALQIQKEDAIRRNSELSNEHTALLEQYEHLLEQYRALSIERNAQVVNNAILSTSLTIVSSLAQVNEKLLRSLVTMVDVKDQEETVAKLLSGILEEVVEGFQGRVLRAMVLRYEEQSESGTLWATSESDILKNDPSIILQTVSELAVPIISPDGALLAILSLESLEKSIFSDRDMDRAVAVGNRITALILLYQELVRLNEKR